MSNGDHVIWRKENEFFRKFDFDFFLCHKSNWILKRHVGNGSMICKWKSSDRFRELHCDWDIRLLMRQRFCWWFSILHISKICQQIKPLCARFFTICSTCKCDHQKNKRIVTIKLNNSTNRGRSKWMYNRFCQSLLLCFLMDR